MKPLCGRPELIHTECHIKRFRLVSEPIAPFQRLQYGLGERSSVGAAILNT